MNPLKKRNCPILRLRMLAFILAGLVSYKANAQSMGISNTLITPDNSSILEMRSTTKGMLVPRMNTTERDAIASPAVGLMVYNTSTNRFNFFNGSTWVEIVTNQSAMSSLNGLTASSQTLATGTTGTDFNIASSASTHTLNLPVASGTNTGKLSNTDWTIFNNKVGTTRTISTTAPLTGGGDLSLNRTLAISNNGISDALIRTSAATSVIGRSAGTTGNVADIVATIDGQVLRRSGTTLGFGTVATAGITDAAITYAKIQNISTNNRLLGRATAGAGATEEITLGTGLSLTGNTLNVGSLPNEALLNSTINLSLGNSGTDINVSGAPASLGGTLTLNIPSASGANRGALTTADWNTFNNKQSALINSAGLAAALSDETGTGLAVFSTSPVLVTPTLGVASATSQTITGTAGAGFLELQAQSAAPATGPANSVRVFSNNGALAWKRSDGFVRSFTAPTITADRTYSLPDASGTVALTSDVSPKWVPVTKTTTATLTNAENFVLGDCTSGSISITLPASPTDGQEVVIVKSGTNENASVTIYPNSGQIIGQALTFWNLTERNHIVNFVYVSAANSWRITARSNFSALGYRKRGTVNPRYYTSPSTGTAMTTNALTANTLYAMPLVIENAVTIDQLLINVTNAGGGSSIRVGIYDDNNNEPDQRIVDCGAISSATTGVKTYTMGLPISLPPGLYWMVAVCSATAPTIRNHSIAGLIPILGNDATLGGAPGLGYSVGFTFGALPATFPASPLVRTALPLPAIFVRFSD